MITLFSVLTGCGEDSAAQIDTSDLPEMPPAFIKEQPDLPGELVGVCYEYSAGSMNYHTEFAIDLNPEEVVHCEYWGSSSTDMVRKDNVPVTEEQWADVEKAVTGLMGVWEEIPEIAQIIAVADTFDAMHSTRPYRKGMKLSDIAKEMKRVKGTQLNEKAVEALLELIAEGKFNDNR